MGRPIKESMPYFSHDTDARDDRKAKLFLANTGLIGWGYFWGLLEQIYKNSYYTPWTEEDQYLFISDFNCNFAPISYEDLSHLTEQALKWGLFSRGVFDAHHILTSPSIQKRYLKQSVRRVLVEVKQEYLVIDLPQFYKTEMGNANVSVKVTTLEGKVVNLLGDYKEDPAPSEPKATPEAETTYESKYHFSCEEPWNSEQPIDYSGCVELWNKLNGCNLRVTDSKRTDLRRVFRNYTGRECLNAMIVRAKDENMKESKYLTQWSTLFGAKKLDNLDKWVDRGREWRGKQNTLETVDDHLEQGWVTQKKYQTICDNTGIAFEDPMFCDTKTVNGTLLYYPKFEY